MLREETILGRTTIRTTPEEGEDELRELRNYAGRIADELSSRSFDPNLPGGVAV